MRIERGTFLKATSAAFFTGGLDVWALPDVAAVPMRVLIAADRNAEPPQLADGDMFTFAGRRWRGTPSIVALPGGHSGVIATVDVERYLYGVIPVEAPAGWPPAALQAQAIVARTFALGRRTLTRPYDVVVSQSDQRFGGIDAEFPSTNAAVDDTHDMTISFGGATASVFYAACCGGHTADAAQIWGHSAFPYLRGVVDPYCVAAPDYRWSRTVELDRIRACVGSRLNGDITGFALGASDAGGRPLSLDVIGHGGRATLSTVEFRQSIGAEIVRSTWILGLTVQSAGGPAQVRIDGAGRGHGVGFCQWGARAMGLAGHSAADILAFYFPGTAIAGGNGLRR